MTEPGSELESYLKSSEAQHTQRLSSRGQKSDCVTWRLTDRVCCFIASCLILTFSLLFVIDIFLPLQPGLCLHLSAAFTSSLRQHGTAGSASNCQSGCVCARPGTQQPGGGAGWAGLISGCRSSRWSPLALGVCSGRTR